MSTLTDDKRFAFNVDPKRELSVGPGQVSRLGELTFTAGLTCGAACYTGFPLHSADGQWFNYGMKLPQNLPEIDSYLYQRLRRRWHQLAEKRVRTKLVLDTDRFRGLELDARTELTWPRLFSHPVVHFPLTAVGNFTVSPEKVVLSIAKTEFMLIFIHSKERV